MRIRFSLYRFFTIVLVLCLAACFEDNVAGGSTEVGNGLAENVSSSSAFVSSSSLLEQDSEYISSSSIVEFNSTLELASVRGISVKGFVQKGPFEKNAFVTIREIDEDGVPTGRFVQTRTDEMGGYSIETDTIFFKHVVIEGKGKYRDELTGKMSDEPVTLKAIVDLSAVNQANVNVLTQLEYDRIMYLISQESYKLSDAKTLAKNDVELAIFGMALNADFLSLDVLGSTEDDIRLLALSALLLNGRTPEEFVQTLQNLGTDLADGVSDAAIMQEIAKKSRENPVNFDSIAANVKSWGSTIQTNDIQEYFDGLVKENSSYIECTNANDGVLRMGEISLNEDVSHLYACRSGKWVLTYLNPDFNYGTFEDPRDGFVYRTTVIGEQTWMAENMHYRGESVKAACYADEEANCDIYGALYTVSEAKTTCPKGWRLPTDDDWNALIDYVGDNSNAGTKLRARNAWDVKQYPRTRGSLDEYGFSAAPSGTYLFGGMGKVSPFHTATNGNINLAVVEKGEIDYFVIIIGERLPVRCVAE